MVLVEEDDGHCCRLVPTTGSALPPTAYVNPFKKKQIAMRFLNDRLQTKPKPVSSLVEWLRLDDVLPSDSCGSVRLR